MFWRKLLLGIAIGKAAVAGAGAGLALLGALNVAAAISAHDWLTAIQHTYSVDAFAAGGGAAGVIAKLVMRA